MEENKQILRINSFEQLNTMFLEASNLWEYKVLKKIIDNLEKHIKNMVYNYMYISGQDYVELNWIRYSVLEQFKDVYNLEEAYKKWDSMLNSLKVNKIDLVDVVQKYMYNQDDILNELVNEWFYKEFNKVTLTPVFETYAFGIDINEDYWISFSTDIIFDIISIVSFYEEYKNIWKEYDKILNKAKRELKKNVEPEVLLDISYKWIIEKKSYNRDYSFYISQKEINASELNIINNNDKNILDFLINENNIISTRDINKILSVSKQDYMYYLSSEYWIIDSKPNWKKLTYM